LQTGKREGIKMTSEELAADCAKFLDYLNENNVRVLAFSLWADGHGGIYSGNDEMLQEMMLSLTADRLGLKLVMK
jgi:hypothetical protein